MTASMSRLAAGLSKAVTIALPLALTNPSSFSHRISDFAAMYAKKLGLNKKVLQKTLWGDFYLNAKTKRIFKGAQVSEF